MACAGLSFTPLIGAALPLARLGQAVSQADVVIAATAATEPVLRRSELARRLGPRRRPIWIADLGLPRNVEDGVAAFACVTLRTMDDLETAGAAGKGAGAAAEAEALIAEATEQFVGWVRSLEVAPTIRRLQAHVAALHAAQTRRYAGRFGDAEQLGRFARSVANKILHHPIAHLRRLAREGTVGERLAAVDTVRRMFDLDGEEPRP